MKDLATLPDWPALMDSPTAILYLGGSRKALDDLEAGGYLERYSNGHGNVRYLRARIDLALKACAAASASQLSPLN